jgi:hypothetical protein
MADSRVRVHFRAYVTEALAALRRAFAVLARLFKDAFRPPSPERLWIREHGRAELAEAKLWFANRCAAAAA